MDRSIVRPDLAGRPVPAGCSRQTARNTSLPGPVGRLALDHDGGIDAVKAVIIR